MFYSQVTAKSLKVVKPRCSAIAFSIVGGLIWTGFACGSAARGVTVACSVCSSVRSSIACTVIKSTAMSWKEILIAMVLEACVQLPWQISIRGQWFLSLRISVKADVLGRPAQAQSSKLRFRQLTVLPSLQCYQYSLQSHFPDSLLEASE